MAAHDGIRSCSDPATVAPRVVASDEIKSALLGEIQCNATQRNAAQHYTNSSSSSSSPSSSLSSSLRRWWLCGHQTRGRNADVRSVDRHRSVNASRDRRAHSRLEGGIGADVWSLSSTSCVSWSPKCHPVPLVPSVNLSKVVMARQLGNSNLHRRHYGDHDSAFAMMKTRLYSTIVSI